jgi:hypothetical protein
MKYNYLLLLFFVGIATQAQLYVSPNTYVYVNDQYVYATGNVELKDPTSNLFLRNSSQLLQGTSGAGNNRGNGALSVFQDGTVNNYQYNYWCSPVGIPVAASTVNDSFGIVNLGRPTTVTATTFTAPLAMAAVDGISSPLQIASRWIYKFLSSTTYSQWFSVGANPTIAAGEGFTMKGTSGTDGTTITNETGTNNSGSNQRYDFRGKPNDGNISVSVANGNFTLVGNPYPSAIDINMVLGKDAPGPDTLWGTADDIGAINNPSINGTAYFWEQSVVNSHLIAAYQGGYGKYTPGGGYLRSDIWSYNADGTQNLDLNPDGGASNQDGTTFARRFSPVGQGFMVMGTAAGSVTMQNKFRTFVKEGGTSQFAKSSSNTVQGNEFYPEIPNVAGTDYTIQKKGYAPQLRINAIVNTNQGFIRTALGFADGYTNGFDSAADARASSDTAPFSFYHILEGSDKEYAMSFSPFDINKKCPVGFRNNIPATFKIKVIGTLYGFDDNQMVYLHDKTTDLYHDIKNAEYEVSLPAGVNNNGYEITFVENALSTNDNVASNFDVFQNNGSGFLTIKNPEAIDLKSCTLYDVSGKTILSKANLGSNVSYEYSTVGLSEGVYIVKLITGANQEITKKVSIFTKK